MQIEVPKFFAGPPTMGHGGYVAGLLAGGRGPVQVTLRRPVPLDVPLELVDLDEGRRELRNGDEVLVEAEPAVLELDVPPPPSAAAAAASEASSPSHFNGTGVHPTCFGCGANRTGGGLRIFAGPVEVDGRRQVAGPWRPGAELATEDGTVDPMWVLAALDCPGAFAFIVSEQRAGLLGRIVFEQYEDVTADDEHVVTGWQVGADGRKLFAGTALFGPDGGLRAAAKATWFGFPAR